MTELLTHSRMSTFHACPRKHHYAYERRIRPKKVSRPLRMGDAVHRALDARRQGASPDEACAIAMGLYDEYPSWCSTEEYRRDWQMERIVIGTLAVMYFWYWENVAAAPEHTAKQVLASEKKFEIPIRNPETGGTLRTFHHAGKRDAVVELMDGRVALYETKTCSEALDADSDYWSRLNIDGQVSGYVISAKADGFDIETTLYDVIRKPTIRPSSSIPVLDDDGKKIVIDKTTGERVSTTNAKGEFKSWRQSADKAKGWELQSRGETPEEFGVRLRDDIANRPEFYFARREIPRTEAELDEYRIELVQVANAMNESRRHGRHYRNASACKIYNTPCPYMEICANKIDVDTDLPEKYEVCDVAHPELEEDETE